VLLNPLPYPRPEQLVTLHESKPNFNTGSISYPNFLDWQKENHTLSSMAVFAELFFQLDQPGRSGADPRAICYFRLFSDTRREAGNGTKFRP